jgi:hypothetical protein
LLIFESSLYRYSNQILEDLSTYLCHLRNILFTSISGILTYILSQRKSIMHSHTHVLFSPIRPRLLFGYSNLLLTASTYLRFHRHLIFRRYLPPTSADIGRPMNIIDLYTYTFADMYSYTNDLYLSPTSADVGWPMNLIGISDVYFRSKLPPSFGVSTYALRLNGTSTHISFKVYDHILDIILIHQTKTRQNIHLDANPYTSLTSNI